MGGEGAWWGMKVHGSRVKVLGGVECRCGCLEGVSVGVGAWRGQRRVYILGVMLDQVSSG